MNSKIQLKDRIVLTGQSMSWLDARKAVKSMGGLPSNVLLDDYIIRLETSDPLSHCGSIWAREVLVYPAEGKTFRKGRDVVDSYRDSSGRKWVFPASNMPENAVGKANVGLFIDPEHVEVSDKRVVVLAESKSIIVLEGFLQSSGDGKLDQATRVPLNSSGVVYEKRSISRILGAGVRPLHRFFEKSDDEPGGVLFVNEDSYHNDLCVAFVRKSEPKVGLVNLTGLDVDAAEAEYAQLAATGHVNMTALTAYRRLLDSLAKKD